jgi:CBS domain-containing protein
MARAWLGPVSQWRREIESCIEERPHDAAIFFDLRLVAGTLDLAPLEAALGRARRLRHFVRTLAARAIAFTPPATFLLRQSSRVDLKLHGIFPVVLLARCHAIELGSPARNTLERLDAALAAAAMSESVHAQVSESYRFLQALRLRMQLRLVFEREPLTSEVVVADLAPLERNRLKDSFRAIRRWEEKAAYRYQTNLL